MNKPDQSRHVSCARPSHFFFYIKYFCWSDQNPLLNHRNPQPCESTKCAKQCRGRSIKCFQNLRRSQENQQEWIQVNKYHTYRTNRICIFIRPKCSTVDETDFPSSPGRKSWPRFATHFDLSSRQTPWWSACPRPTPPWWRTA